MADCTRSYNAKATMAGCMSWEAMMAVQWRDRRTLYRGMAVLGWYSVGGHIGCTMDVTMGVVQYMALNADCAVMAKLVVHWLGLDG